MSENKKIHSIFSSGELLDDSVIRNFRHTADYGKRILATVSQELTAEVGQAFKLHSLYPISQKPSDLLNWHHYMDNVQCQ